MRHYEIMGFGDEVDSTMTAVCGYPELQLLWDNWNGQEGRRRSVTGVVGFTVMYSQESCCLSPLTVT